MLDGVNPGDLKRIINMKIIQAYPPNIEEIEKTFDLTGKKPVFAYGSVLFNPSGASIDEFLLAHEMTHAAQQKNNPSTWWEKYLSDKAFRLSQEAEAYHAQYMALMRKAKDRNAIARYVHSIAVDFSSAMYGNIVSYTDARKIIKYGHC